MSQTGSRSSQESLVMTPNGTGGGEPRSSKSLRLCRHFARGRCTWGDNCRFSHDIEAAARAEADSNSRQSSQQQFPQQPVFVSPESNPSNYAKFSNSASNLDGNSNGNSFILAQQQSQLQFQRHSILVAGLQGQFSISNEGAQAVVRLPNVTNAPREIPITLLSDQQLQHGLATMEHDEQSRNGGLHYLVGEPNIFWSMMRSMYTAGSAGNLYWNNEVQNAIRGVTTCMFYNSLPGCLVPQCPFEHVRLASSSNNTTNMLSMATSNAAMNRSGLFTGNVPSAHGSQVSSSHNVGISAPPPMLAQPPFPGGVPDPMRALSVPAPPMTDTASSSAVPQFVSIDSVEVASRPSTSNHSEASDGTQENWATISGKTLVGSRSHLNTLNSQEDLIPVAPQFVRGVYDSK